MGMDGGTAETELQQPHTTSNCSLSCSNAQQLVRAAVTIFSPRSPPAIRHLNLLQVTPMVPGTAPVYNMVVQYVVDADPFFIEYLDKETLQLELCVARGWDYERVGTAAVSLRQLLDDLDVGAGALR